MSPILEVCDLGFRYGDEPVLEGISFHLEPGESLAVAGPNGAGKSTLLWCVAGLLKASGRVAASTRRIGMVFQNPEDQLFLPSLLEDLMLPLENSGVGRRQAEAEARQALAAVGMERHASRAAYQLSLGQRKRAAIALALVRSPELLILDEPTSELDGRSVRQLVQVLQSLPAARLIASHHLEFLSLVCSRALVLVGGRVAAQGPVPEVFADGARLEAWGLR